MPAMVAPPSTSNSSDARRRRESATAADDRRRSRQLIVSLMDAEPTLVDYLVQNGVVARHDADRVWSETDRRRQNDRLLRAIESKRTNAEPESVEIVTGGAGGFRLLTNALRQTGQHYLANLIDDSKRIVGCRASGRRICAL
jgi:hypothetical protein